MAPLIPAPCAPAKLWLATALKISDHFIWAHFVKLILADVILSHNTEKPNVLERVQVCVAANV